MGDEQAKWTVVCEPHGDNGGVAKYRDEEEEDKNQGGMIIYVTDGDKKEEVDRVAFVRRYSGNKSKTFKAALKEALETAQETVDTMNGLQEKLAGYAQEKARDPEAAMA